MKRRTFKPAGGSEDQRLNALAGVLVVCCCQKFMTTLAEDAPYFSALYGPSRHAIVVPDLSQVTEHLEGLTDCPEDLYLIEGDPQSFDDSVFSVDELESGSGENRRSPRRYSRFRKCRCLVVLRVKAVLKASMPSVKCFPNAATLSLMYKNSASASGVQPLYRQSSGGCV